MTGETVTANVYRKKPSFENARVEDILRASSQRVTPRCVNFGVCGGCSLQHLNPAAQVAAKQRVLEDNLWDIRVLPSRCFSIDKKAQEARAVFGQWSGVMVSVCSDRRIL